MLLVSATMLWLALRVGKASIEAQQPVQLKQLELLDKVTTMLASKGVLEYQGIQAMAVQSSEGTWDPSDAAAALRERDKNGQDWVDDEDADDLLAAFG